jgi:hypothetical protein
MCAYVRVFALCSLPSPLSSLKYLLYNEYHDGEESLVLALQGGERLAVLAVRGGGLHCRGLPQLREEGLFKTRRGGAIVLL